MKEWTAKNPDYEKNRYAKSKPETREKHLIRKYGVSLAIYEQMLTAQGGACAICKKLAISESYGVLHVDHCHKTGRVRGLLCRNCNHVLGLMGDSAELMVVAARYLKVPHIPELIGNVILASIGWDNSI